MNLLLDTHTFLWFIDGNPKLSTKAKDAIENQENLKIVSIASLWEMAIKISLKKLDLKKPFKELIPHQLEINGFDLLQVHISHLIELTSLPYHHRDPFDRLLLSQSISDDLSIISVDPVFDNYSVKRIW